MRIAVVTVSDSAAAGDREDRSGPAVDRAIERLGGLRGAEVVHRATVPDEADAIIAAVRDGAGAADVVITTGGTGLGARDVTPGAVAALLDRELPGFAEAMRAHGMEQTPLACLSRQVCGTLGGTLVLALPGSPKAVEECLEAVHHAVRHAVGVLAGRDENCATTVRPATDADARRETT